MTCVGSKEAGVFTGLLSLSRRPAGQCTRSLAVLSKPQPTLRHLMNHSSLRRSAWLRRFRWIVALAFCVSCSLANAAASSPVDGAGVPDTIEQRAIACTSCHGVRGTGSADSGAAPRIAGQPAAYLALQLAYFQSGQRKDESMQYITQSLTPAYAKEIAAYFSSQSAGSDNPKASMTTSALTQRGAQVVFKGDPGRGVPPCASCHGRRLAGREPLIPGLTDLSSRYLAAQFAQWRSHARAADRPYCMGVVANRMSEAQIEAVVQWLANRPAGDVPSADEPYGDDPPLPDWCVVDQAGAGL